MPDRVTEEELAYLERLFDGASEHLARGHFGPVDIAGRLAEAGTAVPHLVAEVRRLQRMERAARDSVAAVKADCGRLNPRHRYAQTYCVPAIKAGRFCVDCPAVLVLPVAAALGEEWAIRAMEEARA